MQRDTHLDHRDTSLQISEYLRILFRGRWVIILTFLAVVGAVTFMTYRMQPVYVATASLLIRNADQMESRLLDEKPEPVYKSRNLNAMEVIQSRRIAEAVIKSLENSSYKGLLEILKDTDQNGDPITYDARVASLRLKLSVELLKDTDVLKVSVSAHTPFEAAFLTDEVAKQYYLYSLQEARGELSDIRQFLEQQLATVREQLSQSENLEKTYKESQSVSSLTDETTQLVRQSADIHTLYNSTETELNSELRRQDFLRKQLQDIKGSLVADFASLQNPLIATLQQQIADKQTRIASLLANPGPGTDETVAAFENEVDNIKAKLIEEVRRLAGTGTGSIDPLHTSQDLFDMLLTTQIEVKSLTAKAEALRDVMQNLDYQLDQLPEKQLVLARLSRDRQLNENLYVMLNEKYEESRITEAGKSAGVEIVDTAKPPAEPVRPKKKLNILLGILFGFGLGVAIAFFLEFLDDTIKTGDDLERIGLTVLGTIPVVHTEAILRRLKREGREFTEADLHRVESKLITRFSPKSPISEAYRSLRTNIQFSDIDHPKRLLLITSSASKEGKSTSAVNLAITLAQMGSKVLLIDSDLRRPSLHNFFGLDKTYGLSNLLVGSLSFDDVIKHTEVDKLDLITSGDIPPNPAEMVASESMKKFLADARARYQYVVVDSPPVIAVTDAAVLATRVDGTILVVSSAYTNKRDIQRAVSLIRNVRAGVMGTILNNLDIKKIYGSYYYYFHYYQYYYYYGSDRSKARQKRQPSSVDTEQMT
ncbi:polysaccharide biosynthesis tyrosine autokinase [candidate division KSB1 bacterium]|nr:polysaccharide biosynthesis tyrosine autokinase [candidate division KSB1 bacterium]